MKTVSIGITTYGGAQLLKTCLTSIKKSIVDAKYSNFDVLVVDDGSPYFERRDILEVVHSFKDMIPNLRLIRGRKNMGNVARYNTIVQQTKGDIIALIDNDIIVPNRWFWSVIYFLTDNDNVAVASYLSQKVANRDVNELLSKPNIIAIGSGRVPERATELAGYAYAFSRKNYEVVGGFDEKFKFFQGDSDFCCKLAKKGKMSYRVLYPMVYHREHVTYDRYKELDAWNQAKKDMAYFKEKWGCSSKEMEKKFLEKVPPQQVKWYANYSHHIDWDVEIPEIFKPRVRVGELEEDDRHIDV